MPTEVMGVCLQQQTDHERGLEYGRASRWLTSLRTSVLNRSDLPCVERDLSDYWHVLCSPYMNSNKLLESLTTFAAWMVCLAQESHRMHVLSSDRMSPHTLPCLGEVGFSPLEFPKPSSVAVMGGISAASPAWGSLLCR